MNPDEQRDYVEAVDELRRLQTMTPYPPNQHQRRALVTQAARVDAFTTRFMERLTAPISAEPLGPGPTVKGA